MSVEKSRAKVAQASSLGTKRLRASCIALLLGFGSVGHATDKSRELPRHMLRVAAPTDAALTWLNGESLTGELAGGGAGTLVWKSPLFAEPMPIQTEVLRQVDFPAERSAGKPEFRLVLLDGGHLTGSLDAVDGDAITFTSPGRGAIAVRKDQIVCLERVNGGGVLAGGPASLLQGDVVSLTPGAKAAPPYLAAGGRLVTVALHAGVRQTLDLPEKIIVELLARSEGEPEFALSLGTGREGITLETWQDELALTRGVSFASAGKRIPPESRRVHVRLAWDRAADRATVFGPDGKVWAELGPADKRAEPAKKPAKSLSAGALLRKVFGRSEVPTAAQADPSKPGKGVTVVNKGAGLLIERYTVSAWNGQAPPPASDAACLETETESMSGELTGRSGASVTARLAGGESRELSLESLRGVRWARSPKWERDVSGAELWFLDGDLLRGKIGEIKDGKVHLETAFSASPVVVDLKGIFSLRLPSPPASGSTTPLDKLDLLVAGETSLHGDIRRAGERLPRFQPVGCAASLRVENRPTLTMTRRMPSDGKFERAPALLHVKSGETYPVTLEGVGADKVDFTWDAAEAKSLAVSELHAVQFPKPSPPVTSFAGGGWRTLGAKGKSTLRDQEVTLEPGGGIGHAYLLQSGDFSFRMEAKSGLATLRIRLFCQGTARDSDSLNYIVADYGSNMYVGVERGEEGQFENQNQVAKPEGGAVSIRVALAGETVDVFVNDVAAPKPRTSSTKRKKTGAGVVLETASLWGNQVGAVKLSGFTQVTSPSLAGPPAFSDEAKREALLLPRLRREVPPRQVLIGLNGDLLRGEVGTMTSTHFDLRVGLNNLKVPRDRVAAVVWVARPDKSVEDVKPAKTGETSPVEEENTKTKPELQWLDLTNGGRVGLMVEAWKDDQVVGQHPKLGRCSIPAALVHHMALSVPKPAGSFVALANWKFENTPDPKPPGLEEVNASPLLGQDAPDFTLPTMAGEDFVLSKAKGKVVVLDFWATWCGPCIRSLPGLIQGLAAFPEDKVAFVAVNQGETKDQVKRFLSARRMKMPVALDANMSVGAKYQVEGIPQTVVIDPAGKIAFVQIGTNPEGEKPITEAVQKALGTAGEGKPAEPKADGQS